MPTYEYHCAEGHAFEQVQKMSDAPLTKCPACGAKATRHISGGSGLIFKGSGFYITDYGKDGKGARKDPDGASAPSEKSEKSASKGSEKVATPAVAPTGGSSASEGPATSKPAPASSPKPTPGGSEP